MAYELTFEGWVLERWNPESRHSNHNFHRDPAESMADTGCLSLPPKYQELFHILATAGDKTAAVMEKLAVRAEMDQIKPTWTKDYIKSKLRAYKTAQDLDVRI